ncbi:MAG: hypothetical protein ACQES9_11810 [Myxococcota bacterium]
MTKIKAIVLINFILLNFQACSEDNSEKMAKEQKKNSKAVSSANSPEKTDSESKTDQNNKKTKGLLNLVIPKKGEVSVPSDVLAWAVISPQHGLIIEKVLGKKMETSILPYVYAFYVREQGQVIALKGGMRKPGSTNCHPKGKFCYNYPESINPPAKFKTFKWKLENSTAQINFSGGQALSLQKRFPKLQMLELAKFRFVFDGKTLQGTAFGKKGKVNEHLQNGFYYIKQLALKGKMYLLRFGKNGRQVATSLLKSTIKTLKRGRIRFTMELSAGDVGWIFKKLNNLFKIL